MSTMEIYSAIRKTGVMSVVEEWMGPENEMSKSYM